MPTRTEMAGFRSWLTNVNQLNKSTVYNYVSRVRAILKVTPDTAVEAIAQAIDQLTTKQMSSSSFRTPWRHYSEYMEAEQGVKLSVPVPLSRTHEITYPPETIGAASELLDKYFYTPELLSESKWEHFDHRAIQGCWKMVNPQRKGEFWRPPIATVMALFEWSSSMQPNDDTPLWAYKPDSTVALSPRAIAKLIRGHRNNR